ncbi:MAG: hypothetical protein VYE81_03635 [Planctomycetota bacterium]|nr:hypothetical protein [Planctomycetota bacterium]
MIATLLLLAAQDGLIELERPAARRPEDGTFARAHPSPWASGRECVTAFYGQGRASWTLTLNGERGGTLWLRYASTTEVRLPFGWGNLEEAELEEVLLPATGSTSGKYAWGWAALDTRTLGEGRHPFTLGAAPLRLDCALFGGPERPTFLDPESSPALTEREAELLAGPLSASSPSWLVPFRGLEPPEWYDATRLCLHTRLGPPWVERDAFIRAEEGLASIGARSYVRHLRTRGEGQWWPSQAGITAPWGAGPLARDMVARAGEYGLRLVAYYRHLEDVELASTHPDWCCRDDLGRPMIGRNGDPRVCLGSLYLDRLEARLLELAELGVDGVYFDEDHMPADGCWCRSCAAGFRLHAGLDLPPRRDREDPRYRRLLEYGSVVMERSFARLRRRLDDEHPDLAILIGSNRAPDPLEGFASDRLWRLADGVKTEYGKGHGHALRAYLRRHPELEAPHRRVWLALGWTFSRDAAEGRPPHVWCNGVEDPRMARAAAAAVIVHGGVANLDVKEARLPDEETFGAAVRLGNSLSDGLAGARPERWAGVHWPGALREHLVDEDEAYRRIAAPLGAAFDSLLSARLPVGVVTDSLLAEGDLDGYAVLFLPAAGSLDPVQRASVEAFLSRGGEVLRYEGGAWPEPTASPPSWSVAGGPEGMQVVAHRLPGGGRALAITNDPGWVYTDQRANKAGRALQLPPGVDVPPEPCEGVVLHVPEGTGGVLELVTGTELPVEGGVVRVPAFTYAALLHLR